MRFETEALRDRSLLWAPYKLFYVCMCVCICMLVGRPMQRSASARTLSARAGGRVEPPVSSGSKVIWYWLLNGVPTTVIFDKQIQQVWCNGYVLQSVS